MMFFVSVIKSCQVGPWSADRAPCKTTLIHRSCLLGVSMYQEASTKLGWLNLSDDEMLYRSWDSEKMKAINGAYEVLKNIQTKQYLLKLEKDRFANYTQDVVTSSVIHGYDVRYRFVDFLKKSDTNTFSTILLLFSWKILLK